MVDVLQPGHGADAQRRSCQVNLHPYQEVAVDHLHRNPRAALCEGCDAEFVKNYPEQRFHSQACFLQRYNKENADGHSNRGAAKGGLTRGQQMKDGASGTGYVKVSGTDAHEHRAVAVQVLGRLLELGEVVHHDDRNKQNNDPANLIVFASQGDHARHHKLNHCGLDTCPCDGIRLREVMP